MNPKNLLSHYKPQVNKALLARALERILYISFRPGRIWIETKMTKFRQEPYWDMDHLMKLSKVCYLAISLCATCVLAQPHTPSWAAEAPYLDGNSTSFETPIKVLNTKLYVEVSIANKARRFVFDTGSPSMIDLAIVKELGLKAIGKNRGVDAHGASIETDIVQTDIRIGNTTIKKLPMMAANFSESIAIKEFVGDGVLGSDLLPLGVWQLDLSTSTLRFDTDIKKLPNLKRTKKLKMYQFGYPYMPIFDIRLAKDARSKALLDTGSPTFFAISPADFAGAKKASGIGSIISGYGSPGHSLGGQAPNTELKQIQLKNLSIGKLKLGKVVAQTRDLNPSLIGSKLLENYIITFDSKSESAFFRKYSDSPFSSPSFGFSLAFSDHIFIGSVWDNTPAEAAGLKPGIKLMSINGREVKLTKEGIRRTINAMEKEEINLTWESGSATLKKQHLIPFE